MLEIRARRCAFGVLILLATMPLLWQSLGATPIGTVRVFHFGVLALLLIARPDAGTFRQIVGQVPHFGLALTAFTLMLTAAAVAYGDIFANPGQNAVYALVGLYVGASTLTALRHDSARRMLAWASPATLISFVLVFGQAVRSAGVNPLSAYREAVSGSPDTLLYVYRVVFTAGSDHTVHSETRHEMYSALFVAVCVSSLVTRERSRATRIVVGACQMVTLGLIAVSLSRAVVVGVVVMVLLALLRMFLRGQIPVMSILTVGAAAVALPNVAGEVYGLLAGRFINDTTSYQGRVGAWSAFTAPDALQRLTLGGGKLSISTHTMIGDAFLHGGFLASVAAVWIVLGCFLALYIRCARRWLTTGEIPALAAAGLIGITLVRSFTSGGGFLQLTLWNAFGITAAYLVWVQDLQSIRATSRRSAIGNDTVLEGEKV